MLDDSALQSLISSNTKYLSNLEEDVASLKMSILLYDDTPFFNLECTKKCVLLLTAEIKDCKKKIVKAVKVQKKLRKELKHVYWYAAWAKDAQGYNNPQKELLSSYGVLESFQTVKECLAINEVEAHWHGRVL